MKTAFRNSTCFPQQPTVQECFRCPRLMQSEPKLSQCEVAAFSECQSPEHTAPLTQLQLSPAMVTKMGWIIFFWMVSASIGESRREHHPLCRALENGQHQQHTQYPSAYTCRGDGGERGGALCTSLNVTSGASTRKVSGIKSSEDSTWVRYQCKCQFIAKHLSFRNHDIAPI